MPNVVKNNVEFEEVDWSKETAADRETVPANLGELTRLCKLMIAIQAEIEKLAERQSELNEQFTALNMRTIPEMMQQLNLSKLTTVDGFTLSLEKFYSAKIPEGMQDRAFAWLRERELDAIIKAQVSLQFGKGKQEKKMLAEVQEFLDRTNIPYTAKEGIHASTLKAFVKERIEGGLPIDQELFGVFVGNKVKIKEA